MGRRESRWFRSRLEVVPTAKDTRKPAKIRPMHELAHRHADMNQQRENRDVTVDELQWYVVLAETEHMTEAAARLNVAQPTLSRALARLERRLGTPLFDRVNRRLRLNRYGEVDRKNTRLNSSHANIS